jgi:hypothetical protein
MLVDIVTLPYPLPGKVHDCLASHHHRNAPFSHSNPTVLS